MCAVTERKSPPDNAGADEPSSKRTCNRSGDAADTESLAASNNTANIVATSRDNAFDELSWWVVDLSNHSQGASALVKRCMRTYSWDESKARKVLDAYHQFITLKKELKDWDANILSPCHLVDQMWHCHILDVANYCHDMMLLCGRLVGHNPDGALDYVGKQMRDEATRVSLLEHFESYDVEVWNFSQDMINIRVKLDKGEETVLEEVMRTTKMQDVFRRYAATKGFTPADSLTFRRNNKRIHGNKTVADLGLEENDLIDCVLRRAAININLRFRAYNREEITINVRRTDKLRYALREYVIRIGRSGFVRRFEFIKDKSRFEVHPDSTPERLQMTDNDLIYCYVGPQNDDFANEENESITVRLKDLGGQRLWSFSLIERNTTWGRFSKYIQDEQDTVCRI